MTDRFRRDNGPRDLGPSLDALSRTMGLGESQGLGRLYAQWDEIVGSPMAAHVRPVRIEDGVLSVVVDHPAWATQVSHLSEQVLGRVERIAGISRPCRLDVRVRP